MLLAKRRIPIFMAGLIALFAMVLLISIERVNAADSVGVPGNTNFEAGKAMAAGTGWSWTGEGDKIKVAVFLAAALNDIAEIEVFVGDGVESGDKADLSQTPTSSTNFPTGTNIVFAGTIAGLSAGLVPGTTKVGIHLTKSDDTDSVRSKEPTNTGLVDLSVQVSVPGASTSTIAQPANTPTSVPVTPTPIPTPTPVPADTPTPVPPAAGDVAPSSSLLLSIMLAGLLLVAVGGMYMVGFRKAKQ